MMAVVTACTDDPPTSNTDTSDVAGAVAPETTLDAAVVAEAESGTTLAPPDALDELVPGLLSADRVGVPADWFILDLDPALVDDPAFAGDLDPFRGLVECPSGAVRSFDTPWLARRYSVADTFLDNGVLSIEVIVHLDDAAGHAERIAQMHDCAGTSPDTTLLWSESTVDDEDVPEAIGIPIDVLRVEAEPDEQTPFPYTMVATALERSGFSVVAIVGGQPPDAGWDAISERVAVDAVLALEAG